MSLAPNGAAGVKPDMDPFLAAVMGKLGVVNAGVSVVYGLDDNSPSNTIWDLQHAVHGHGALRHGRDSAAKRSSTSESMSPWWSSAARHSPFWTRTIYATADAISKGGLTAAAFPTEPATPVTNGVAPPGFTGQITLDGKHLCDHIAPGKINVDVARDLPMDGFNSYYGLAPEAGDRTLRPTGRCTTTIPRSFPR